MRRREASMDASGKSAFLFLALQVGMHFEYIFREAQAAV